MELSTNSIISNAPLRNGLIGGASVSVRFKSALPLGRGQFYLPVSGSVPHRRPCLRISALEESSGEVNNNLDGERSSSRIVMDDYPPPLVNKTAFTKPFPGETSEEDSSIDDQMKPIFEYLEENLNIKLDSQDPFSILLYGGGSLVTLWLLSAVVGAIDAIPLFPKLMEVVGLSYSVWFTTRYLLFKRNRDELRAKIDELKGQVLGTDDD